MGIQCFFIVPNGRARVGLRRYSKRYGRGTCPSAGYYHNAIFYIGEIAANRSEPDKDGDRVWSFGGPHEVPHIDGRWPKLCDCGYEFAEFDDWQVWHDPLYQRTDTGEKMTTRDAKPGAMWDAWWYPWKGPDGLSLMVRLPNGHDWCIDGRANNCTMPQDTEHRCWVRHGKPPVITVDKNGLTCAAGAGSILSGDYHGFLRGGRFEP
jgi:hypothetical protein